MREPFHQTETSTNDGQILQWWIAGAVALFIAWMVWSHYAHEDYVRRYNSASPRQRARMDREAIEQEYWHRSMESQWNR